MKFSELEVVRVKKDIPEASIKKGDIGTIVLAFTEPNEAYEVEFLEDVHKSYFGVFLPDEIEKYETQELTTMMKKSEYPLDFPKNLMEKAIDLNKAYSKGCYGAAWKKDDIIRVIDFLAESGFVILGGDAYLLINDELKFLGDTWCYEENIVEDSVKKAKNYIHSYLSKKDKDYSYFSITFEEMDCNGLE